MPSTRGNVELRRLSILVPMKALALQTTLIRRRNQSHQRDTIVVVAIVGWWWYIRHVVRYG